MHAVKFSPSNKTVELTTGALLTEAAQAAGLELAQPCGGQGRCGRCAVIVETGAVRCRSTMRLSAQDVAQGYVLACQSVIEGDAAICIPEQETIERRLVTDKAARKVSAPFAYDPQRDQTVRMFTLTLPEPTLDDAIDDLSRLKRALAAEGVTDIFVPLHVLRELSANLRATQWQVNVIVDTDTTPPKVLAVRGVTGEVALYGLAVDIGTTTVSVHLVNLLTGESIDNAAEYNGQIARGEDVIARIIYAGKGNGLSELSNFVRSTIKQLIERLTHRNHVDPQTIYKVTVAGNTTMIHLVLQLPPDNIRLTPYIPTVNQVPILSAADLELAIYPLAVVDVLPGVASYVGADITAGVLSSGLADTDELTLFIDVGTNGEMVLGTRDWFVTCACSAGPAFEGAGVVCGMRATRGAIEEVWVNNQTYEPTYRVVGDVPPKGICGSGLISLLAELFITGVVDKGGNFVPRSSRVRNGEHGMEYVVAWANQTAHGRDIVITKVDIDNLMRAKAAIYAGFTVLAQSVGVDLADVQKLLVGGSFGKYINVEKAVQIGLLPDMPWEQFQFLGNTSVFGAYLALLSRTARARLTDIAAKMTYLELSADNTFYDSFTSALFLPHTDVGRFPSVAALWETASA